MSPRGPAKGTGQGVAVANATAAWEEVPDWIMVLARACEGAGASQTTIAKRIGYSPSAVSAVLNNKYAGDLARVEAAVRGALMAETIMCPVLGELGLDRCQSHQRKAGGKFRATSGVAVRLYHACRGDCAHSRIKVTGNVE